MVARLGPRPWRVDGCPAPCDSRPVSSSLTVLAAPTVLAALGSAGMGLAWGWLLGRFRWRRAVSVVLLVAATGAMVVQVWWHAGMVAAGLAAGAAVAAIITHLSWRRRLARRYDERSFQEAV